jgi:hypothetical protein
MFLFRNKIVFFIILLAITSFGDTLSVTLENKYLTTKISPPKNNPVCFSSLTDTRQNRAIGQKTNALGVKQSDIIATNNVSEWISELFTNKLSENGFHTTSNCKDSASMLTITGTIDTFFTTINESYSGKLSIAIKVQKSGKVLLNRRFTNKKSGPVTEKSSEVQIVTMANTLLQNNLAKIMLALDSIDRNANLILTRETLVKAGVLKEDDQIAMKAGKSVVIISDMKHNENPHSSGKAQKIVGRVLIGEGFGTLLGGILLISLSHNSIFSSSDMTILSIECLGVGIGSLITGGILINKGKTNYQKWEKWEQEHNKNKSSATKQPSFGTKLTFDF